MSLPQIARAVEPGDVLGYIQAKGWKVQKREQHKGGQQIVVDPCPLCGKRSKGPADRHFYIAEETGLWNTWCCQQSGNMISLRQRFGDLGGLRSVADVGRAEVDALAVRLLQLRGTTRANLPPRTSMDRYVARLWAGEAPSLGLTHLRRRGFDDVTVRKLSFGMVRRGYCEPCKGQTSLADGDLCPKCRKPAHHVREMLAIPYLVSGVLHNFKFRSLDEEKRFERWTGAPTVPWNVDSLDGAYRRVLMTEAELDGATLVQVGYNEVVSLAGATNDPDDELLDKLARFDEVVLAYDGDEAGTKACARLAEKLGKYRCRVVAWPAGMKDANECLQAGMTAQAIRGVIEASVAVATSPIKGIDAYAERLKDLKRQGRKLFGRESRWLVLNELLGGGWRDGELTVVTGDTGHGKSTWCVCAAWDQARGDGASGRVGVPTLVASFELMPELVAKKVAQMESGKAFADMTEVEIDASLAALAPSLWVFDRYGSMALADLCDVVEYGVRRHGLKFVVVDHLHFFLGTQDERDERRMIDGAMDRLVKLVKRLAIHVLLVVHPAKLRIDPRTGSAAKVEPNDLKGASSIKQGADNIVRVYLVPSDERPHGVGPCAEVATRKVRDDAGRVDAAVLSFDRASLRYEYDPMVAARFLEASKPRARKRRSGQSAAAFTVPPEKD